MCQSLNSLRTAATTDEGLWWTNIDLASSNGMEIWCKENVPLLGSVNRLVIP